MASILFKILRIWNSQFKCQYVKNESLFLKFFLHFWILYQILNILKEKMIVIANVFPKLQTVKILVRPLSKKRRFRTRFDSEHVKASQMPAKMFVEAPLSWFFIILREVDLENVSPSVTWNLRVFVNTLTADGKYPRQGCRNLQLLIQMQLSEKRKTFSMFLFHFWMLHQILNILKEKMIVIANVFPKLQTVKIFVRKFSKEHRFGTGFGSQHVKASKLLAKSPWERFYYLPLWF